MRGRGNERFGAVEPWEEACLGAEQHEGRFDDETAMPWVTLEFELGSRRGQ